MLLYLVLFSIVSCNRGTKEIITIETEKGNIIVELYPEKAPITVENFLKYIDEEHFKNAEFYRTVTMKNQPDNDVKIEVIQGGIWNINRPDIDAIEHETTEMTGIKHLDGTISMARSNPGSATSEFFICVNDQPSLDYGGKRNPDNQGFAAFGRVTRGMDIVRSIHSASCENQSLNPSIKILNIESGIIAVKKIKK